MTRPLRNRDTCERTALAKIRTLAVSAGWPALTLEEDEMVERINADGGFPVRLVLDGKTFDVRRVA
jgi:hypothetical protein